MLVPCNGAENVQWIRVTSVEEQTYTILGHDSVMKTNKVLDSVIDIASFLQEETIYDLRGR